MLRFRTNTHIMFAKTEGGRDEKFYLRLIKEGIAIGEFTQHKGKNPGTIAYISEIDQKITGGTTIYLMKGFYIVHEP
ncbi:MAG: hypothetical protein Q8O88_03805 [bacterium]|nr:hypothetical protein [bacterium]